MIMPVPSVDFKPIDGAITLENPQYNEAKKILALANTLFSIDPDTLQTRLTAEELSNCESFGKDWFFIGVSQSNPFALRSVASLKEYTSPEELQELIKEIREVLIAKLTHSIPPERIVDITPIENSAADLLNDVLVISSLYAGCKGTSSQKRNRIIATGLVHLRNIERILAFLKRSEEASPDGGRLVLITLSKLAPITQEEVDLIQKMQPQQPLLPEESRQWLRNHLDDYMKSAGYTYLNADGSSTYPIHHDIES